MTGIQMLNISAQPLHAGTTLTGNETMSDVFVVIALETAEENYAYDQMAPADPLADLCEVDREDAI
ncbi:MAG: hypothetical protein GY913_27885 [Proteobacteria bacterium]|nr:hypothetical protein [Pseudomonadota bacterium]MCP4920731.1 hypothetical protein [Pseudomonadota bacterium]